MHSMSVLLLIFIFLCGKINQAYIALFYYVINITIPNHLHEKKLQGGRPEAQISLLSFAEAFKLHMV